MLATIGLTLLTIIFCYVHVLRAIRDAKDGLSAANSNNSYRVDIERRSLKKVLTYIFVFILQYIPIVISNVLRFAMVNILRIVLIITDTCFIYLLILFCRFNMLYFSLSMRQVILINEKCIIDVIKNFTHQILTLVFF